MDYSLPKSLPFDIGSTRFVAGGFWHKAVSNLTRERARNTADLEPAHVITRRNYAQFGISGLDEEDKPRFWEIHRSAAAALADADPTDWIAAYRLGPTHVWIVAVREGLIEFDAVFSVEETAKREFSERYAARSWRKAFAPTEWHIEGTQTQTIDRALSSLSGPILMPSFLFKERSFKKAALPTAVAVVGLVALGLGITYLPDLLFVESDEVAGQLVEDGSITTVTPELLVRSLPEVVPIGTSAEQCVEAIYKLYLAARTLPGWEVGAITCDTHSVSTRVRATEYAELAMVVDYLPGSSLDVTSRVATVRYILPALRPHALSSVLESPSALHLHLARIHDAYKVRFLADQVSDDLPGTARASTARWSLKTQAPPMFWTEALEQVPSAELSSMEFDPTNNTWSVGGVVHVS